jgi:hypothetical protein
MIGIAGPFNLCSAIFADKIFLSFYKNHIQFSVSLFYLNKTCCSEEALGGLLAWFPPQFYVKTAEG